VRSAVVVVNWNSGDRLKACLESLPADAPVVVVDNASADDSIAHAETLPVTFIKNSSNRGFAAAVNQGVAATSSAYVLLLNPDARVMPGSIETLERILDENPRTGAVGGYVNDRYLPRRLATPWTVIRENLGYPVRDMDAEEVEQAAAAALLVRREAFAAVGGFDERFVPAWYEDVDFCRSLRNKGWKIRFSRAAHFSSRRRI
jgi:GT2 family glycosyltransferase